MGRILTGRAVVWTLVLMLTSCASLTPPDFKAEEQKQEDEIKGRSAFFVCNKWIDINQNGRLEENELEGRSKDTFRAEEPIMLAALFRNQPKGTKVSIVIWNPAQEIVKHAEYVLPEDNTSVYRLGPYLVRDILQHPVESPSGEHRSGPGVFLVQWFIGDVLVGERKVTLIQ